MGHVTGKNSFPSECLTIDESPNQPRTISFPKQQFGTSKIVLRAFNPAWFNKSSWLHWDDSSKKNFCYTCVSAKTLIVVIVMPHLLLQGFKIGKILLFLFKNMRILLAISLNCDTTIGYYKCSRLAIIKYCTRKKK